MTLDARLAGRDGDPVVFLHGFAGSHHVWRSMQDGLAAGGRMSLAYDLPGHAGSLDYPDAGPAKVAVRAVTDDLDRREWQRIHLVGHSFGGAVATLLAAAAPSRVRSLTLLAPGGFGPQINARLLRRFAEARDEPTLRLCREQMYGWTSALDDDDLAREMELRAVPGQIETLCRIVAGMTRDGRQGAIPREMLESLAMPVSVVWGQIDNVLPVGQAHGLPARFAVHVVPDRGHMLVQEVPGLVREIVARNAGMPHADLPQ